MQNDKIAELKKENEELKIENEKLKIENELLKTIIDNIHESVIAVNKNDEIILYNCESEKMEGLNRNDVLGKKEDDVYAPPFYFSDEVVKKVLRTGIAVIEQPYWYYLNDGRQTNMIFSVFPYLYKGQIFGAYIIFRNVNQMSDFIARTLEMRKRFFEDETTSQTGAVFLLDHIIGSGSIKKIKEEARSIARRDSPVLIVGETGTGKELFSQGIHNASLRSKGPFISVNCAAIPETLFESLLFGTVKGAFTGAVETPGLFEQAEDGTIFFDEINSMPLFLQAKLLRVLQVKSIQRIGSTVQKPINCRIISATNNDPVEAIERKLIRSDLYFRLATITLNIPPLRERKEDINYLAASFIKKYNLKFGLFVDNIAEELLDLFDEYYWPGNVRELENFIEGAMNFVQDKDKTLNLHHLPEYFRKRILFNKKSPVNTIVSDKKLQSVLSETEKEMIESILAQNNRNITKTARELGISRQNLYYKFKILGIKK